MISSLTHCVQYGTLTCTLYSTIHSHALCTVQYTHMHSVQYGTLTCTVYSTVHSHAVCTVQYTHMHSVQYGTLTCSVYSTVHSHALCTVQYTHNTYVLCTQCYTLVIVFLEHPFNDTNNTTLVKVSIGEVSLENVREPIKEFGDFKGYRPLCHFTIVKSMNVTKRGCPPNWTTS